MLDLSIDQEKALKALIRWFQNPHKIPFVTLGGYAGTGKTTLVSLFRHEIYKINPKAKVAFCSYTGKAALVLKQKLKEQESKYPKDTVGTIHSLIYSPITNVQEEIIGWETKDKITYDLIIIDEASMLDAQIWSDINSYKIPIIAVGDHGQLPPINGNFNLMEKPHIRLEEIHRQAKENPIIKVSLEARQKGTIPFDNFGKDVKKVSYKDIDDREEVNEILKNYNKNLLVLCGYNNTRVKLNNFIRSSLEFENPEPSTNDRVICLRNNHKKRIFNGMLGTIKSIKSANEEWYRVEIEMDGEDETFYKGNILKEQFNKTEAMNFTGQRAKTVKGDLFDFGYAMTVHKAQGSQAEKVIVFEERFKQMDDNMWKKWLYTAVTRAEKELIIVG